MPDSEYNAAIAVIGDLQDKLLAAERELHECFSVTTPGGYSPLLDGELEPGQVLERVKQFVATYHRLADQRDALQS